MMCGRVYAHQGVCFLAYGPTEGDNEKREMFWNYLNRVFDRVGNVY